MGKFIVDSVDNGVVTLRVPGANYRNSFALAGDAAGLVAGARVRGKIVAPAWKVDRVELGGNYVEPLFGRPRRMQGTITAIDAAANQLVIQAGYEAVIQLGDKYRASDFAVGQRVGCDNVEIPTFTPESVAAPVHA